MPFPVAKLAYLVIKQTSKPMANLLKNKAKTSPWLRTYLLVKPAQWYHRRDTGFRLRLMGLGKTKEVKPLTEEMAVDLGADMLGEIFIFTVGVSLLSAEYWRQSRKESKHESSQDVRLRELEDKIFDTRLIIEEQSAQIRELNRLVHSLPKQLPETIKDSKTGTVLKVENR